MARASGCAWPRRRSGEVSVSRADALESPWRSAGSTGRRARSTTAGGCRSSCPAARRSLWSRINRDACVALIERGEMRPSGLRAVEKARADGRWDAAYEPPSTATVPPELQAALDAEPRALEVFGTLDSRNRYAILHRIAIARRPETRARRIAGFVAMLARGETIY